MLLYYLLRFKLGNLAEAERFERSVGFPTHAFQACALDRYATPPFCTVITCRTANPYSLRTVRLGFIVIYRYIGIFVLYAPSRE